MLTNKKIRVIKRDRQSKTEATDAQPAPLAPAAEQRSVRMVVSEWVREHQQRAEQFRSNYASLLKDAGFTHPSAC